MTSGDTTDTRVAIGRSPIARGTAHDVVVMTTHDIGRRLRSYGHPSVISPHADSLAEDGVRFARAFCTAPQCSPSRASLATGRYPHNNGVMGLAHPGFDWELDPAVPHLAAVLQMALPLAVFIFLQRYFVRGITSGSVKG